MIRSTAIPRESAKRATAQRAPAPVASTPRRRLLALLVAAIAALGLAPAASALTDLRNATGVPYNTIIVSGDAWLGGGGVNIMSNQGRTLTGPWQCVELVNRLYDTKGWINPGTWTGNGADKYRTAPPHLMKEPQGGITRVNPGDVVVFNTNYYATYGHVAVVDNVIGSNVYLLQQNAQPASKVITWSGGNLLVGGAATKVTGIVHSPESSGSRIALARNKDGRLQLFAVGANWEVYHRWQTSPGGAWSSWSRLDGAVSSVAVETNADGRLELFAVGLRGEVYHRWQTSPGGSWSAWAQLDGSVHSIALARNKDGRLELFAVGQRGEAYRRAQTSPGGAWSGWSQMDGRITNIAAETNADGRLELFAIGSRGEVYHRWQTSPGGAWSAWKGLDGAIYREAVSRNKDGRLELFAVGLLGEAYHRWQVTPGGAWSGWSAFDGRISNIATETNADGRLELFAVGLHGEVYHRWQTSPGGAWSGWKQLDGSLHP
jgi:hypothetical protein